MAHAASVLQLWAYTDSALNDPRRLRISGLVRGAYRESMPKSRVRRDRKHRASHVAARWRPSATVANLDPAGLPGVLFPSDITGWAGPSFAGYDLDYVVASERRAELLRMTLRFERRLATSAAVDMWGFDSTKAFSVHMRLQAAKGSWTLTMRTAADPLHASQALLVLDLVELLHPPNAVALTEPGTVPDAFSTLSEPSANMQPPTGLADAIRDMAVLEAHLGQQIAVPPQLSEEAVRGMRIAAEVLRGETVRVNWEHLDWVMSAAEARDLAEGPLSEGPAVLDLRRGWTVDLGEGQHYEVPVSQHYRAVRVAEWPQLKGLADDIEVLVKLEPADKERSVDITHDYAALAESGPDRMMLEDDPLTLVPDDAFGDLVASLDVDEEPNPALARAAAHLRSLRP
jgi:hypothetical protein